MADEPRRSGRSRKPTEKALPLKQEKEAKLVPSRSKAAIIPPSAAATAPTAPKTSKTSVTRPMPTPKAQPQDKAQGSKASSATAPAVDLASERDVISISSDDSSSLGSLSSEERQSPPRKRSRMFKEDAMPQGEASNSGPSPEATTIPCAIPDETEAETPTPEASRSPAASQPYSTPQDDGDDGDDDDAISIVSTTSSALTTLTEKLSGLFPPNPFSSEAILQKHLSHLLTSLLSHASTTSEEKPPYNILADYQFTDQYSRRDIAKKHKVLIEYKDEAGKKYDEMLFIPDVEWVKEVLRGDHFLTAKYKRMTLKTRKAVDLGKKGGAAKGKGKAKANDKSAGSFYHTNINGLALALSFSPISLLESWMDGELSIKEACYRLRNSCAPIAKFAPHVWASDTTAAVCIAIVLTEGELGGLWGVDVGVLREWREGVVEQFIKGIGVKKAEEKGVGRVVDWLVEYCDGLGGEVAWKGYEKEGCGFGV